MNAIVNHLGFNPFEVKGMKLKEEVITNYISITYGTVGPRILYTQEFGSNTYNYIICLPLEINVNYNLIKNERNLVEYLSCSLTTRANDNYKFGTEVIINSNYIDSDTNHQFQIDLDIKILYLVLPEEFQITATNAVACKSYKITF